MFMSEYGASEAPVLGAEDMCSKVGVSKYMPVLTLVDGTGISCKAQCD